ncbi:MAG TPA: TlpA family protein disulfide reductase [Bdellovibrionales bacterium]|nr:TlpA family protein disulfide reductase [Bdellovibrionales bacterium]
MSNSLPPDDPKDDQLDALPGENYARTAPGSAPGSVEGAKPKLKLPEIPVWAKLLLMAIVVLLASVGYLTEQTSREPGPAPEVPGDSAAIEKRLPAPDADLITNSGATVKLSSLKGKVALVSFWAHWCAPCLVELPSFKTLHSRVDNPDFVVVPVNLDEGDQAKEFIANFWKSKVLPFETYFDPQKNAAKSFDVETLPANFVLDREGRIVVAAFGSNDWSNDSTVEMIESLLNEK